MSTLKISVAQFEAQRDVDLNLSAIKKIVAKAAPESRLIILPENSMYSDPQKEAPEVRYAESLKGSFVTHLKDLAQKYQVHILAGMTEINEADTDRPYNTLVRLTPEGELDGIYRKIHLYDAFGHKESDKVTPADIDEPLIFRIDNVTVGALTCYDVRFPEISRWLAERNVDVIALPAAWAAGAAKEFHWDTLVRARAIENTVYFAASGQTGPSCTGQSLIVDPMGVTLASAGEATGSFANATIDTDRLKQVRSTNPSLTNRRFNVSPILVGENG